MRLRNSPTSGLRAAPPDDHLAEISSKSFAELLADLAIDHIAQDGQGEHEAYLAALEYGLKRILIDLLQDERYGYDDRGAHLLEATPRILGEGILPSTTTWVPEASRGRG